MFEEERLKIKAVLEQIEAQERQIEKQRIKDIKKLYWRTWLKGKVYRWW